MTDIMKCPICDAEFKPADLCAEDIEMGTCHAECLEGSPVVDLDTGQELPEGSKPDTYFFAELDDDKPFAWYWYDSLGCLYMTGDARKPQVPADAKPLYERPAPPPQAHAAVTDLDIQTAYEAWLDRTIGARAPITTFYAGYRAALDRTASTPPPQTHVVAPQPCGIANPSTRDCPNMKEVGGGMDGERYRCDVCGKGYFLDYEEMK